MALAGQRKLIRIPTPTGPAYRAYDLAADPAESVDRFDASSDYALAADLAAWSAAAATPPSAAKQLPKTVTRELRSLGYLE
jgi:hypothetical protein